MRPQLLSIRTTENIQLTLCKISCPLNNQHRVLLIRETKPFQAQPSLPTSYYQNNARAQYYDCHLTFYCLRRMGPQLCVLYEQARNSNRCERRETVTIRKQNEQEKHKKGEIKSI